MITPYYSRDGRFLDQQGGVNFTADEFDHLLSMGMLATCNSTGRMFSVGKVEVIDRYSDCTGFRCPCCKQRHDDRQAWSGPAERRMGYTVVKRGRR